MSLEVIKHSDGRYECSTDYGRESSGVDPCEWAVRAVELDAGELVVTSTIQEGTGMGYDLDLTRQVFRLRLAPAAARIVCNT